MALTKREQREMQKATWFRKDTWGSKKGDKL